MQKGCKTCSGWAFGYAQIPASDAMTQEVIPACIPRVSLRQSYYSYDFASTNKISVHIRDLGKHNFIRITLPFRALSSKSFIQLTIILYLTHIFKISCKGREFLEKLGKHYKTKNIFQYCFCIKFPYSNMFFYICQS